MGRNYLRSIGLAAVSTFLVSASMVMASQEIISPLVRDVPVLDGSGIDPAWQKAKPYIIRDKRLDVDVIFKSVHSSDMVFFYVQFPDATEDKQHKPWIWDKDMEIYTIGTQREDTFQFRWNMEDHKVDLTNYSDDTFSADVWYWKAERTNVGGYADDKYHTLTDKQHKKSWLVMSTSGKTRYLLRLSDQGESCYKKELYIDYQGDIVPQYSHGIPTGSRADVKAKGVWHDGYWSIEFARKLDTGHSDDMKFVADGATKHLFGVSIKSLYGEQIDDKVPNLYGQGRISEPLSLVLQQTSEN